MQHVLLNNFPRPLVVLFPFLRASNCYRISYSNFFITAYLYNDELMAEFYIYIALNCGSLHTNFNVNFFKFRNVDIFNDKCGANW